MGGKQLVQLFSSGHDKLLSWTLNNCNCPYIVIFLDITFSLKQNYNVSPINNGNQ